jgi:hypothetical protein
MTKLLHRGTGASVVAGTCGTRRAGAYLNTRSTKFGTILELLKPSIAFQLVLPNPYDAPTPVPKSSIHFKIALPVSFNLGLPK